jgi:gamma-glutamyl:cysteine ligase YbdK (ATP-grasp superfamily)
MANLHKNGLTLLGSAMHPWMNPLEMKLWPFGQNEIYQTYDRIFGCQGHGWCNLQSVHINLPFADEKEFTKLHHAVRLIMPLIPRLAAASPVFEGKLGALPTNRLKFYENNQRKVPSITGKVIPPAHQDYASYYQMLEGMFQEIKPHDPEGVLSGPWLNSHGAIAKFDVQAIEIRIMDIQECPLMDFAIVQFVELLLKNLLSGLWGPIEKFSQINTDLLRTVYDNANSWQDQILPLEYSNLFSSQKNRSINLNTLLQCLFEDVRGKMDQRYAMAISFLLTKGNLSQRIKSQLAPTIERQQLHQIYQQLQHCLQNNVPFLWNS